MRWLINYIRSCFCKHEWEMIFDCTVKSYHVLINAFTTYDIKTYRCKKCGYSKKYRSS